MTSHVDSEESYRLPAIPQRLIHGADELNLAEFPICSFSSNPTQRGSVYTVEDEVPDPLHPGKTVIRRVEILSTSKDDPLGPLTPDDEWVLLGLLQLTKLQLFTQQIRFTRYQLLKLLGWQTNARDYSKLRDSLMRLRTFHFRFYNGFFDAKAKSFVTTSFSLFNDLSIYEQENSLTRPKPDPYQETFLFACSSITWSDKIHGQFINRGVKAINFEFAKSLKRPLTRRLFRFLDKNFFFKPELSYDLETFVTAHLGLAARQEFRDIKKTLVPAIHELEELNFLKTIPDNERFVKLRRSADEMEPAELGERKLRRFKYQIVFHKGQFNAVAKEDESMEIHGEEERHRSVPLIKRGVSEDQALKLVEAYSDSIILHQVDVVDWLQSRNFQFKTSMGGFLRDRIVNHKDRPDPQGFVSRAKRAEMLVEKKQKKQAEKHAKESAEHTRTRRLKEFETGFASWWEALGEEGRRAVDAAILSQKHDSITLEYLQSTKESAAVKSIWRGFRTKVYCDQTGVKPWGE